MITKTKQHHDRAAVNDDLHGGDEFRSLEQVKARERNHDDDQRQRAVNRVTLQDQADRSRHCHSRQNQEHRDLQRHGFVLSRLALIGLSRSSLRPYDRQTRDHHVQDRKR